MRNAATTSSLIAGGCARRVLVSLVSAVSNVSGRLWVMCTVVMGRRPSKSVGARLPGLCTAPVREGPGRHRGPAGQTTRGSSDSSLRYCCVSSSS